MPAGEPFTREIQSCDAPDELQHRVIVALSALLAPANYKLAAQRAEGVEYHRQYVRPELVAVAVAMIVLALALVLAGYETPVLLGLAALALLLLAAARRTEVLQVRIEPRPGGSAAVLSGHLNGRGRMALLGLDPMSALPLRETRRHLRVVDPPAVP
jgi:hypothetical protein